MFGSKDVAKAAIRLALTGNRDDEKLLKEKLFAKGIEACGCDFGGEFISSISKIIESAVVAAKRENIIGNHHTEEGAVAGAAHEAVAQIAGKALGLNAGGKLGIARSKEHIVVCAFFGLGLIHLNEVAIGLGHRVV